jgi:two-component system, OmpR family, response regulator RpaA
LAAPEALIHPTLRNPTPPDLLRSSRGFPFMIRLLIVEDDPALRAALSLTLETAGFDVHTAEDGEQGVALASQLQPDVILMDIMLPRMNGWEAKLQLTDDPIVGHVPVIGVSALGDPQSLQRARELGFADYLVKPIRLAEVTEAIHRALPRPVA